MRKILHFEILESISRPALMNIHERVDDFKVISVEIWNFLKSKLQKWQKMSYFTWETVMFTFYPIELAK